MKSSGTRCAKVKKKNLYADLLSGREAAVDKGRGNGSGRLVSHHPEPTW